ncbi:Tn3 family transposase [Rhizobium sullae]|uniref:Tn3 family transposase n=1 Tax=Rhizobium sullae TaxID=50338 RepID=A0ABY5XXN3_RHISU|nr:Tn3 family transposase [Rhizobium sullae]UWU19397.1 Tn3 family transposase [Rhizobium sullae]
MTRKQRDALLTLPETEVEVLRHHMLGPADLAAVNQCRTPETRLSYALQLCCLRFPGRYLSRGELLPGIMLDHIADQVQADADVITLFARRGATRYQQLTSIKQRHGFRDLSRPLRDELTAWAQDEAVGLTDGRVLLDRLIERMRSARIIIPGISVVERLAATAMHSADLAAIAEIGALLSPPQCDQMDVLLSAKVHRQQSRLSWLRAPAGGVGARSLAEILDRLDLVRNIVGDAPARLPLHLNHRMAQMAREGSLYTAQAFQQMNAPRRHAVMMATLSELATTLTDAALSMFQSLVGRANLRAKKRLEETIAASAEQGRARLLRIAEVLDAVVTAVRSESDVTAAVAVIAPLDTIADDAAIIRRTLRPGRPDVLGELAPEYHVFRKIGARFLSSFAFEGGRAMQPLLAAIAVLGGIGGDRRKPLPADVPLGHIERRWSRYVFTDNSIDRSYYELATYFILANALASGGVWVATSRIHRPLEKLLAPASPATPTQPVALVHAFNAEDYLSDRMAALDAALLNTERHLSGKDAAIFADGKLRFPKEPRGDNEQEQMRAVTARLYAMMPRVRITDLLDQVNHWTDFTEHFSHVSTGLPPVDQRAFMAALIAEATNLGLSRMAEMCGTVTRRALLRMQTWHMREDTYRAALASMTDAIHAEPLSVWFGEGWRASADGQAYYLGGPGEAGGTINGHYGRDPIVKIYTTITDRYAPLHQKVIAGTAGEAIHALDGILGHESNVDIGALHVDGGGVSDIVFAIAALLGRSFEPRIPRLSDRKLYAFEPKTRYGRLAPLFGHRLDAHLILGHADEIGKVIRALADKVVTPSLILKKLSAYRQQNSLAAALREIGRIERTLFTLRWFEDPALRQLVTAELNKGEARNTLARAVAFHRLGRFRDRSHENQASRAAALNLVTAAIVLFNCRYLGRITEAMRRQGRPFDEKMIPKLSPLGWDHINITGDYVWSDALEVDEEGLLPIRSAPS